MDPDWHIGGRLLVHGGRRLWVLGGGKLFELGTMLLVVSWTTLWRSRIRRGLVRIAMGLSRLLLRRREVEKVASSSDWLRLEDFRLCFSGKIAQVYNGFQYDLVDRTQDFTKNVEIRKKIQLQDYDGQADLQTILDPNMIGLRLP